MIAEVFTPSQGRHAGVIRGGTSRKLAPILQPGAQLDIAWKARLEDHMGNFAVEPLRSRAAQVMGDRISLAGLNAVTGLLCYALPEREPHRKLYARTEALLDLLGQPDLWPLAYLHWELALLEEMGHPRDFTRHDIPLSKMPDIVLAIAHDPIAAFLPLPMDLIETVCSRVCNWS